MSKHITFDRFKLSLPITAVTILKPEAFNTTSNGEGVRLRSRYEQNYPFYYSIVLDYNKRTSIVEYSGKVLLDDYPALINYNNICCCFENINRYGICYINPEQAVEDAYVLQCDVTRDVRSAYSITQLYSNLTLQNNRKWCIREVTFNRFTLESTVVTNRKKTRMVIYNKHEEMSRKPNEVFLANVSNSDSQREYFRDKIRFELNLNSVDRIRYAFETPDNRLTTLLHSKNDPIESVLTEVLYDDNSALSNVNKTCGNLRDMEHLLLLAICDFDIKKVERVIRDLYGSSRSITRAIVPYQNIYRQLIDHIPKPENDLCLLDLRNHLRYALSLVFGGMGDSTPNLLRLYQAAIEVEADTEDMGQSETSNN